MLSGKKCTKFVRYNELAFANLHKDFPAVKHLKISAQLFFLTASLVGMLLVVGIQSILSSQEGIDNAKNIYEHNLVASVQLGDVQSALSAVRQREAMAMLEADSIGGRPANPQAQKKILGEIPSHKAIIAKQWQAYMATHLTPEEMPPEEKVLATTLAEAMSRYNTLGNKLVELLQAGRHGEAALFFDSQLAEQGRVTREALSALIQYQAVNGERNFLKNQESQKFQQFISIGLLVVGIAAGLILSLVITRNITVPLAEVVEIANAIANKQLNLTVPAGGSNETGQLLTAFGRMQRSLHEVLGGVRSSSGDLSQSALQLQENAAQISQASQQQSEAASAMAAAVEELTTSIEQVAQRAQQAQASADQTRDQSRQGSSVVRNTANEMRAIASKVRDSAEMTRKLGERSQAIDSIVGTIRDIADQTNLLALNAAIEAARAGEQGRGFAVVADEVRKLAERTSQSTQQIGGLIATIRSEIEVVVGDMQSGEVQMESGVALAEQAQSAIDAISNNANEINQLVHDISLALKEQTVASQDVARNVEQVAQLSEENSRAVMQTADATVHLKTLASQLDKAVHSFRL